RHQMRRREKSDAQTRRAINAFEHRAGRAFAVGAGDVNEAQFLLRIPGQRRELECVFQAELQAKQAQVVEKLDGVAISHWFVPALDLASILSSALPASFRMSDESLSSNRFNVGMLSLGSRLRVSSQA